MSTEAEVEQDDLHMEEHRSCQILLSPSATWVRAPLDECKRACLENPECETLMFEVDEANETETSCRFTYL